jgi:hypothetical protein
VLNVLLYVPSLSALSIWCEQAGVSFGDIVVPGSLNATVPSTEDGPALECPASANVTAPVASPDADPIYVGPLVTREYDVTGEVYLLSESVIEIQVRFKKPGFGELLDTEYCLPQCFVNLR